MASHLHVQEFDSLDIRSRSDHLPLGIANELDHILSCRGVAVAVESCAQSQSESVMRKFKEGGSDRARNSLETQKVLRTSKNTC